MPALPSHRGARGAGRVPRPLPLVSDARTNRKRSSVTQDFPSLLHDILQRIGRLPPGGVQAGKSHCQACSNPLQTARGRSRRVYTLQLFGMRRRPREASLRNPGEFGRITKNPGCLQAQGSLAGCAAQPPQGNQLRVGKIPPGEGRVGGSPPSSPWRRGKHPAALQDGSGPREPGDGATHKSFPRFHPGSLQPG